MKYFIVALLALASFQLTAQTHTYYMNMTELICSKTTEEGEDEVYLLVIWRTSSGRTGSSRLPVNAEHWSMNDSRKLNSNISPGRLLTVELAPNETMEIFCGVMEQDDGTVAQYANAGSEFLRITGAEHKTLATSDKVFLKILGDIKGTYHLKNSDDFIGGAFFNASYGTSQIPVVDPSGFPGTSWGVRSPSETVFSMYGDGCSYNMRITFTAPQLMKPRLRDK